MTWLVPMFEYVISAALFMYLSTCLGPMKEKDLTPGTVFPVLGTLLFFLPERYREKLCCVTPLSPPVQKVISYITLFVCFSLFVLP